MKTRICVAFFLFVTSFTCLADATVLQCAAKTAQSQYLLFRQGDFSLKGHKPNQVIFHLDDFIHSFEQQAHAVLFHPAQNGLPGHVLGLIVEKNDGLRDIRLKLTTGMLSHVAFPSSNSKATELEEYADYPLTEIAKKQNGKNYDFHLPQLRSDLAEVSVHCETKKIKDHELKPYFHFEKLPRHVLTRNTQRSFTSEHYYHLKDGRLWYKPNEKTTGIKAPWRLFLGDGRPQGHDLVGEFRNNEYLVEMAVDAETIVAVSNRGIVYKYQPTYLGTLSWDNQMGIPGKNTLYLPPHRAWTFSFSVAESWKRKTPMKDIVDHHEDTMGQSHVFGLTGTIYSVDPNGQLIRYWDTGLPPQFDKAFQTPENGTFVAENICAAASTVFVINKYGRMYTRLFDYELNGGAPGTAFSYSKEYIEKYRSPKNPPAGYVYPFHEGIKKLPVADWYEQPALQLKGKAQISTDITIIQTGEGNAARELRVVGTNELGQQGFYAKKIFAKTWHFVHEDLELGPLTPQMIQDYSLKKNEAPLLGRDYVGRVKKWPSTNLDIELINFHPFAEKAQIRFRAAGEWHYLMMYFIDQWTPEALGYHKGVQSVGREGRGSSKALMGTLKIPRRLREHHHPEVRKIIKDVFLPYHLVDFLFTVKATDENVFIKSHRYKRRSWSYLDYDAFPIISMDLKAKEDGQKNEPSFTQFVLDSGYKFENLYQVKNYQLVEEKLIRNKFLLEDMESLHRTQKWGFLWKGSAWGLAAGFYLIFDIVTATLNLPQLIKGGINNMSMRGGHSIFDYVTKNFALLLTQSKDFHDAKRIIENRIYELEKRLNRMAFMKSDQEKDFIAPLIKISFSNVNNNKELHNASFNLDKNLIKIAHPEVKISIILKTEKEAKKLLKKLTHLRAELLGPIQLEIEQSQFTHEIEIPVSKIQVSSGGWRTNLASLLIVKN